MSAYDPKRTLPTAPKFQNLTCVCLANSALSASLKRGAWVEILTETLEMDIHLPRRKHLSTQGLFEEPCGHGQATPQHARNRGDAMPIFEWTFPGPIGASL